MKSTMKALAGLNTHSSNERHNLSQDESLRRYNGIGKIRSRGGIEAGCRFVISQSLEGRIVINCTSSDRSCTSLAQEYESNSPLCASLDGTLEDLQTKLTADSIVLNNFTVSTYAEKPPFTLEFLPFSPVIISFQSIPEDTEVEYRIGLTNLLFLGTEWITTDGRNCLNRLSLSLEGRRIKLELLGEYGDVRRSLEKPSVRVTSHVLITSTPIDKTVLDLVETLCILLSFASGTWITWLWIDHFKDGQLVRSTLYESKTLPSHIADHTIDCRYGQELKTFLESAYPIYTTMKSCLGLNIVVEYYIHSKSARLMELKYLIACIGMECLNSHLSDYFKIQNKQVDLSTFRKNLNLFFNDISMSFTSDELDFIDIRDKIVHTGRFPSKTNYLDEYRKLINLFDRTILTILGYLGKPYLNVRKNYTKELLQ